MSPYQDDDFSKAYTTALYQTKGTVTTNVKVKSDENLEVDLLFVSNLQNSAWVTEDLGLFDELMKFTPPSLSNTIVDTSSPVILIDVAPE